MELESYTIREAAKRLGLATSTIRYYCSRGLVRHVRRSRKGYRVFTTEQLDWLHTLHGLRQAGFSIEELRKYAQLHYSEGDTLALQKSLLATQKRQLWQQLEDIKSGIDFIERQEELLAK